MSRHRLTLKIYASNWDFWREDKIIDRLSRVQEKLSGFDYLDSNKIQEKLKEDTEVFWHQQKIQQGKDFWKAIKVTAWDVFDKLLDRPQGDKGEDEFLSFEGSEEMRSKDFFKDFSETQRTGAFRKNEELSAEDAKENATSKHTSQNATGNQAQEKQSAWSESCCSTLQDTLRVNKKIRTSNLRLLLLKIIRLRKKIKAVQDKIYKDYDTKITFKENTLSFEEAETQLKERYRN